MSRRRFCHSNLWRFRSWWTCGPEALSSTVTNTWRGVGGGAAQSILRRAKANCTPCAGKSLEHHLESFKHKASALSKAPRQFSCLEDTS